MEKWRVQRYIYKWRVTWNYACIPFKYKCVYDRTVYIVKEGINIFLLFPYTNALVRPWWHVRLTTIPLKALSDCLIKFELGIHVLFFKNWLFSLQKWLAHFFGHFKLKLTISAFYIHCKYMNLSNKYKKNPTEVQVFFCNYPLYDLHNFPMNYVFKSFKISIIQRLASHIYWIISNCLNAKIRIKYSKNLVFSARIFYLNLIHFLLNDSFFLIS